MRHRFLATAPAIVLLPFVSIGAVLADERPSQSNGQNGVDGFVSIFDGTSLDGWHAVPNDSAADWSVENGVIVGQGSADRLAYLVWKDDRLTDFELTL